MALSLSSGAQFKKHIVPGVLVFASGCFEGMMDVLQYRYDGFKRTFPKSNDQFFDPRISWQNKYKDRDPQKGKTFAGNYLVGSTDAWHGFKSLRNATNFSAFAIRVTAKKRKWHQYVKEALVYWAVNRAGFTLIYKTVGY